MSPDFVFEGSDVPASFGPPVRLQLRRTRGFDLQSESRARNGRTARSVARPGFWGNPFTVECMGSREAAVAAFGDWLAGRLPPEGEAAAERREAVLARLPELAGLNLACWCRTGTPCHADVLIGLANR